MDNLSRDDAFLNSLYFNTMSQRYDTIIEAHEETYDWIFAPEAYPERDARSQIEFRQWLENGTDVYWISGKPGSGKSTLMKFLATCKHTRRYLRRWAGNSHLISAAFYFWIAGGDMQRSQLGLLRQLLFETLNARPSLIGVLHSQAQARLMKTFTSSKWRVESDTLIPSHWTLESLIQALTDLGRETSDQKICYFIDGLDEYDKDHLDLIATIETLCKIPNVKVCVSSRRWPAFENAYGSKPGCKLYLEDLTYHDIFRFARDKLASVPQFDDAEDDLDVDQLAEEIAVRSEGVFLWVFLVIRSLRDGITNGDDAGMLQKRLDQLPTDLEPFFERILRSVDTMYHENMKIIFQVALQASAPLPVLVYWLLDEEKKWTARALQPKQDENQTKLERFQHTMTQRLLGRYKGLLEPSRRNRDPTRSVHFLHRTVRDYLQTRSARETLHMTNLSVNLAAFKATSAYAKLFYVREGCPRDVIRSMVVFGRRAELSGEMTDVREARGFSTLLFASQKCKVSHFIAPMIEFGFTTGLQHLYDQATTSIAADIYTYEEPPSEFVLDTESMVRALEAQTQSSRELIGENRATDALGWLLRTYKDQRNMLFFNHVAGMVGLGAGLYETWPVTKNQWQISLKALLENGIDINEVFKHPEVQAYSVFPWIGMTGQIRCQFSRTFGQLSRSNFDVFYQSQRMPMVEDCLNGIFRAYQCCLAHGLDPNRILVELSVWEMWIWQFMDMLGTRLDSTVIRDFCRKMTALFLQHGANPFARVRFQHRSESTERIISVRHCLQPLVEAQGQDDLLKVLQNARNDWRSKTLPSDPSSFTSHVKRRNSEEAKALPAKATKSSVG
ncbi:hypothetical protein PSPO01_05058 [Paraphaeosphaeria sporulosa]